MSVIPQVKMLLTEDNNFLKHHLPGGEGHIGSLEVEVDDVIVNAHKLVYTIGSDAAQITHGSKDRSAEHMTTLVLLPQNMKADLIKSESYVILAGVSNTNDKDKIFLKYFLEPTLRELRELDGHIFSVDLTSSDVSIGHGCVFFKFELLEKFKLYDMMLSRKIFGLSSAFDTCYLLHSGITGTMCNSIAKVCCQFVAKQFVAILSICLIVYVFLRYMLLLKNIYLIRGSA